MHDLAIYQAWAEFAVRWLHVTAGIAWIGSSFYFIALDLGLRQPADMEPGVSGEEWQVHGGGFYHVKKFTLAPDRLSDHLVWFKWEAYTTWLTGIAMLILVYYLGADLFLIDPAVADLSIWQAVAISLGSLVLGWLVYDAICRSRIGQNDTRLMLVLFAILVAVAYGYTHVFSGRAALLHLGAFTGSIMAANVFFVIIPNQKVVVADLKAGRTPDPEFGRIGKQRSTHNNYLTLPVIFMMLSNHYPLAFASRYNWLIASLVFLMGVTIRHYFNVHHSGRGNPTWTWAATAVLFIIAVWLSTLSAPQVARSAKLLPGTKRFATASGFTDVTDIVEGRCAMCHTAEPGWPGIATAPRGVLLDSPARIARHARQIYLMAGLTNAMPPANVSQIEPRERAAIVRWYRSVAGPSS